jgi:hypothetical protein
MKVKNYDLKNNGSKVTKKASYNVTKANQESNKFAFETYKGTLFFHWQFNVKKNQIEFPKLSKLEIKELPPTFWEKFFSYFHFKSKRNAKNALLKGVIKLNKVEKSVTTIKREQKQAELNLPVIRKVVKQILNHLMRFYSSEKIDFWALDLYKELQSELYLYMVENPLSTRNDLYTAGHRICKKYIRYEIKETKIKEMVAKEIKRYELQVIDSIPFEKREWTNDQR